MLAIGLAGLLFGVAVPAIGNVLDASRMDTARLELVSDFSYAQSRAVGAGTPVVLCPSQNADSCTPGSRWEIGWIAFHDLDSDGVRDAGERVIVEHAALTQGLTVRSSAGRPRVVLQPNAGAGGTNATITLCDARGPARASRLIVSNQGGIRQRRSGETPDAICPDA